MGVNQRYAVVFTVPLRGNIENLELELLKQKPDYFKYEKT